MRKPVKISKNPMALRPRAATVAVVVDAASPELGDVRLTLCEIPGGLLEELNEDLSELAGELSTLNKEVSTVRDAAAAAAAAALAEARQRQAPAEELAGLRRAAREGVAAELADLRARRKELVTRLQKARLDVIAWGVCGHALEDFEDGETGQPFPFQAGELSYDGVRYVVAGAAELAALESIGRPFLDALFNAVMMWQSGRRDDPAAVYKAYAEERQRAERVGLALMRDRLREMGVSEQELGDLDLEEAQAAAAASPAGEGAEPDPTTASRAPH